MGHRYYSTIALIGPIGRYVCMDQPGKVANPASGQLNWENYFSLSPFAPENLVSRDGFGSHILHILHTTYEYLLREVCVIVKYSRSVRVLVL